MIRKVQEAAAICGVAEESLFRFISYTWLRPIEETEFDEEDIARARLIRELQEDLGVNDAAVPIILHLIDQIHRMQGELRRLG